MKKLALAIKGFIYNISVQTSTLTKMSMLAKRKRFEELRMEKLLMDEKNISAHGYKVFSQSDEDGIIQEIFARIGTSNKIFVEFGVGDGLENNTAALLYEEWKGLWIEGSEEFSDKISSTYSSAISTGQLKVVNIYVSPENINEIISGSIDEEEIDLLSIDIDGNDAHVFAAIECVKPRVIVFEYNAKFGPVIDFCMAYNADHRWHKSDCFGASLKHFEKLAGLKGYGCVGCNLVGTNAFFVRNDLLEDRFIGPYTSEQHYEPARYELADISSGHPASASTFNKRVIK